MKNIFKKENLMPVIVLGVICLAVAALMGCVNMITGPIIQKAEEQKVYDSLREVLDGEFEPLNLPEGAPSTVKGLYKVTEKGALVGHVVTLEKQGYASKILLTVGIDKNGKTTKVVITGQQETHGKDISPLLDRLSSVDADSVMDVEHVTNATKTSDYIKEAVADAFKVIGFETPDDGNNDNGENGGNTDEVLPKTDDEIIALAGELVGETTTFTNVTPGNTTLVKRVYRADGGQGYVVYLVSISANYGTVDTENLVHIGKDGTIKAVKKLTWSVSAPAPDWGYNPPSDEDMDDFYNGLVGKDSDTIGGVDLSTGATNTTTTLVNSITEALAVVEALIATELPRPESEVKSLATELVGEGTTLTDVSVSNTNYVKRVYRADGSKGYVVYVVSISERYGTVDTENLVYIGMNGAVKAVKKLTWSVSDANPDWGYNPPSEDRLTELYNSFVGKNSDTIGDVDLATGATNTTTILVNTIIEAIDVAKDAIKNDLPRSESEIESLAAELIGSDVTLTNITPDGTNYIKRVYRAEGGKGYIVYVVSISERYGTIDTENLVHIGMNGAIKGIKKLTWSVSAAAPDWGYNPPSEDALTAFYSGLVGKDSSTIGSVDLATGATNTTTILVNTLTEALTAVKEIIKNDLPRPESEIESLAAELVGSDATLTNVTPDGTNYVKRVWRVEGGLGYVVYVVSISERYGTIDTENIVYIGTNGAIKGIKKLTWSVSAANPEWGYNPPSEDDMVEFYNGLVGKNSNSIGEVDLATGATNTTTILVNTITEALTVASDLIKNDLPRPESEIIDLATGLVGKGTSFTDVTPDGTSYVKKVYRADGGKGYVVYVVSISERYGTIDTENLVYIGTDGTIKAVKKLTWSVSAANPDWGYNPPDEDRLAELYNSFVGKNSETLGEVDLATGATNTTTILVNTLTEALNAVSEILKNDLPRSESEIESLIKEFIGQDVTLTNITPANTSLVKRLYSLGEGNGYVAYVVAISPNYGTVETESLIHIDSHGVIVAMKSVLWKVSDAVPEWGYNPPSAERVEQLYSDFAGKDIDSLDDVDIATGATSTGTRLVECVTEALESVRSLVEPKPEVAPTVDNTARIVGIVVVALALLSGVAVIIIRRKRA